jgi:prevent-host-death family protein
MIKQVTVTDLQNNAAKIIRDLRNGPVVVSQRGRRVAVIIDAETFAEIERKLKEIERKHIIEIVPTGLADYRAGRVAPHATVVRRVRNRLAER